MSKGNNQKLIVVTGMHRSGTTFIGRLLSHYRSLQVIHEPLNKVYGLSGVNYIYPVDFCDDQSKYYLSLLQHSTERFPKIITKVQGEKIGKTVMRAGIGGRTKRDFVRFFFRNYVFGNITPVFKDPFAVLLVRSLLNMNHHVLVLIRHPAAVWTSICRMGWSVNLTKEYFGKRNECLDIPSNMYSNSNIEDVERFSWLWRAIYSYISRELSSSNMFLLKHESFCLNPNSEIAKIEKFLNLSPSAKSKKYIRRNMFESDANAHGYKLHEFRRDSKYLTSAWRSCISRKDENIIRSICEKLVVQHYGEW